MATREPENVIRVKTTYTFAEAIEYLKVRDKQATNINESINWYDVKTGEKVYIGYSS